MTTTQRDFLMQKADAAEAKGLAECADALRAQAEKLDADAWDAHPRNASMHR